MKRFSWRVVGIRLLLMISLVCVPTHGVDAQQDEPWLMIGTWNLDFTLSPLLEEPLPQSRVIKYWWEGDRLKHTTHVITANGEHRVSGWEMDRNFKPFPPSTIKMTRIDAHNSHMDDYRLTRISWKDGKHFTFIRTRPNGDRWVVHSVEVYTKQ